MATTESTSSTSTLPPPPPPTTSKLPESNQNNEVKDAKSTTTKETSEADSQSKPDSLPTVSSTSDITSTTTTSTDKTAAAASTKNNTTSIAILTSAASETKRMPSTAPGSQSSQPPPPPLPPQQFYQGVPPGYDPAAYPQMLPGFPGQTPTQQQFLQQFQAVNGRGVMPHNFEHILAAAAATANTDKTNSSNNNNTESDSKNDSAANDANNTNEDTDDDDAIQSDGDPKFTTANAKSTKAKSKTMKSKASANARANGTTNGYGAVYGSPLQMQGGFSGTVVGSNTILSSPLSSTSTAGTTQVHLPNDIALFSPPVYSTMVMPRSQVPKNHRTSSSVPVAPAPSTSGDQDEMIPVTIVYLPFYLNDGLSVMRSLTKLSPTAATTSAKGTPLGAGFTSAEVTSQLKQTQATPTNFNAQSSTAVPPASATTGRKAGKTAAPKKGERHRAAKTPYACEKCGKNFISQSKLTRHMLVHTLAKDHGCDICGNRFGQKAALRVHVKRKHGGV